jgi:hypothetical protein
MEKVHGIWGSDQRVVERGVDRFIIDVENHMVAAKLLAPTVHGIQKRRTFP